LETQVKAIRLEEHGGPEVLKLVNVTLAAPGKAR